MPTFVADDFASRTPSDLIDPHIHQWDPLTTERAKSGLARALRFVPRLPRSLRWAVSQADREFVGNPAQVLRPYLPADYRKDAADVPVASVVHIEAAWPAAAHMDTVDETRWVTTLPFGRGMNPQLGGIVVHADPRWSDVGNVLDAHLEASPLVRGVRFSGSHHPDPGVRDFAPVPHVWSEPAFIEGFAEVAQRGLSMELWCYAHQLPDAVRLVEEYPETTFVLNHYATPVGAFGPRGKGVGRTLSNRADQLARWRDDVNVLGAHSNVVAKHSGLGMPLLGLDRRRPVTTSDLAELTDLAAPFIQHLHAVFGPNRTMWASNYPMDKPGLSLPGTIRVLVDVLGNDADLAELLHGVARRTYRIGHAVPGA